MTTLPALGKMAWRHVQALVAEIGPRPAGSAAERQAFEYVTAQLSQWGYAVERLPVKFAPPPRFFALYVLGGLALAAGSWCMAPYPWAALLLPLLIIALPQVARWLGPRRARTADSEHRVAYTAAAPGAPTLLFCAHVDSARASVFKNRALLWLQSYAMFLALRVAFAAAALAVLKGLGFQVPPLLIWLVAGLGSLVGGWWALAEVLNQLAWRGDYAPGAHDNASGVGVVLALAEHFASAPPRPVRLGFLFTGAEETGLHGALAFAEGLAPAAPIAVLNFDMVGAGTTLRFATGDGTLWPRRTDAHLNALIQAARPEARGLWYTLRSGDFLPFLRRGIRAASLQTSGLAKAEQEYHTVYDGVAGIEVPALEMTAQTALRVAQAWPGPRAGQADRRKK